ncbi:Isoquinoline 1-oxidoreductase subunit [Ideonella azotifigens]|uniref:Isoquinoline 1-oxidoreductase subunit n=1 Tax=Ideonella azotifigens TaxID=513160 RepID=A0ABN1KBT2_9BURK|nr:Isoquinoline 1-oxidoreductase subunit [Ideonella azotifigens]MCD2343013.1 Isoquinoline 1-oxidoreductase subunit [Ideonella azotifigens]
MPVIRTCVFALCAAAAAASWAADLRTPESFASTSDPAQRSRELFLEAGKVLQHPRCLNCHPNGDRPTQGMDLHPHLPLVVRGKDDKGAVGMRCTACHQAANVEPGGFPGNPLWHLAPGSMAWQGKTLAQICVQIKDKRRNGGKSLPAIQEHMASDGLVGWAWAPGGTREPAPGTQEQLGALIKAWIDTGAFCPAS